MSDCEHERQEKRRLIVDKNHPAGYQVVFQCLDCGQRITATAMKHDKDTDHLLNEFDVEFRDQQQELIYAARAEASRSRRARDKQDWFRDIHNPYLSSEGWKRRRDARIRMADYTCEAQLEECTGFAIDVHHITYEHHGNEPLWELRAVCKSCHEQITAMDRARRGEAA